MSFVTDPGVLCLLPASMTLWPANLQLASKVNIRSQTLHSSWQWFYSNIVKSLNIVLPYYAEWGFLWSKIMPLPHSTKILEFTFSRDIFRNEGKCCVLNKMKRNSTYQAERIHLPPSPSPPLTSTILPTRYTATWKNIRRILPREIENSKRTYLQIPASGCFPVKNYLLLYCLYT